ncbi:CBS domain-containing protein [Arundinibacter roseus]|uniref:CBS domain-containing protein n=1 Tax=Arundinibacter roseus TaxID=2070510 RepID=A0A4R4K9N0_9BACT|nr:CBS domain-containing protein [Arundinibacter roseus]
MEDKPISVVFSVPPTATVIETLHLMAEKNIGAVVVLENENLVGIFSERDYARKGIIQGRKAKSTPISEVMTPKVFTVSCDMSIQECMQLFSQKKIRHLPVVENDRVVGVLSIGDIVNSIMFEQKVHIQFLEQYITQS